MNDTTQEKTTPRPETGRPPYQDAIDALKTKEDSLELLAGRLCERSGEYTGEHRAVWRAAD